MGISDEINANGIPIGTGVFSVRDSLEIGSNKQIIAFMGFV